VEIGMHRAGWKLAFVLVAVSVALPCRADTPTREYQVKAAFVYNFTQFVVWPDSAFASKDSPFVVATIGDDPFNGALEAAMNGKSAASRPIVVKHFSSVDDAATCQLLFVPASQDSNLSAVFSRLDKKPILAIGENDAFMAAGGGIRFYIDGNRIRFEIDPDSIAADALKVSAKLMKLARIYQK
jgi:hypothetical protein